MQSLSDPFGIGLFSDLIQTVLCSRLSQKPNFDKEISITLNKLKNKGQPDWVDLNFGLQTLSKLRHGSDFQVKPMFQGHFKTLDPTKYEIWLEIFTLHNKRQQLQKQGKQDKNKLVEKWVFRKEKDKKREFSGVQKLKIQTDLIFKVLTFIKAQNHYQTEEGRKDSENVTKAYQIVIKSYCQKKRKTTFHRLDIERKMIQLKESGQVKRSTLFELPNFWQKSVSFDGRNALFTGCYFYKPFRKQKVNKVETLDSAILKEPDRKLSSETKAEEKQSTPSFKFSLESLSFRLSGNKQLKQSSEVQPIRKTSEEISNNHRPRFQSIYESKDEEMNIFILSPRRLSQEQSPKMKHLEQKPVCFEIDEHKGISEEVIEEFVLERDDQASNGSSEGFEMLEENDQLDSINQEKSIKALEKAHHEQKVKKQKQLVRKIEEMENQMIFLMESVDEEWLLSI